MCVKKIYWICSLILSITFVSCTYENEEELFPNEGEATQFPPSGSSDSVSFSARVKPILEVNCNSSGCHGAGTGAGRGNFTTYEGVKLKVDNGSFERRVLDQQNMPPSNRRDLTSAELNDLRKWINAGALNN